MSATNSKTNVLINKAIKAIHVIGCEMAEKKLKKYFNTLCQKNIIGKCINDKGIIGGIS